MRRSTSFKRKKGKYLILYAKTTKRKANEMDNMVIQGEYTQKKREREKISESMLKMKAKFYKKKKRKERRKNIVWKIEHEGTRNN